jgi:hypothetical protein
VEDTRGLADVTDVEFDGLASEDESPLASSDSAHKYDTGHSSVTSPPEDEEDAAVDDGAGEEATDCVLDDLDVDARAEVDDDFIREAAERVGDFRAFADEIGVQDTALARVVADRLDVYADVPRSPTADAEQSTEAGA